MDDRSTWSLFIARRLVLMGRIICRKCGDDLSYVSNHWIHLRLPIAKAWTHPVEPVEAGSGGDAGAAEWTKSPCVASHNARGAGSLGPQHPFRQAPGRHLEVCRHRPPVQWACCWV